MKKIPILTTSFDQFNKEPIQICYRAGLEVVFNRHDLTRKPVSCWGLTKIFQDSDEVLGAA